MTGEGEYEGEIPAARPATSGWYFVHYGFHSSSAATLRLQRQSQHPCFWMRRRATHNRRRGKGRRRRSARQAVDLHTLSAQAAIPRRSIAAVAARPRQRREPGAAVRPRRQPVRPDQAAAIGVSLTPPQLPEITARTAACGCNPRLHLLHVAEDAANPGPLISAPAHSRPALTASLRPTRCPPPRPTRSARPPSNAPRQSSGTEAMKPKRLHSSPDSRNSPRTEGISLKKPAPVPSTCLQGAASR